MPDLWAERVRVQGDCRHPYLPDEPNGYTAWFEWAEQKAKTHFQRRCRKCGLWVVWVRRRSSNVGRSETSNDGQR